MPLPGGLNTITVTSSYPNIAGQLQSGSVTFDPGQPISDSGGQVVMTNAAVQQVWNGKMQPVVLPCTDNAGLNPTGFQYKITETIGTATRVYYVYLPHTLGATVDLSSLTPTTAVSMVITNLDGGNAISGGVPAGSVDGGNA